MARHNFLAIDPDGPARRILPFVRQGSRFMLSLGMAAALVAAGVRPEDVVLEDRAIRMGERHLPLVRVRVPDAGDPSQHHDQDTMLINYRAPVQARGVRSYPTYEVRHLLQSEAQLLEGQTPAVDPQIFKNKVVFVGLTVHANDHGRRLPVQPPGDVWMYGCRNQPTVKGYGSASA